MAHMNFKGNPYGPIAWCLLFREHLYGPIGPESSSKVSLQTGIGPWMALPSLNQRLKFEGGSSESKHTKARDSKNPALRLSPDRMRKKCTLPPPKEKHFGELFWPQRKDFPGRWSIRKPYKNQESHTLPTEIFPLWPLFFCQEKFLTGAVCFLFPSQQRLQSHGVPKSGVPKRGTPKAGFLKPGVPKIARFRAGKQNVGYGMVVDGFAKFQALNFAISGPEIPEGFSF